jgi:hypothetical protein
MASLCMGWDLYRLNITLSPCLPHCISLELPQSNVTPDNVFSNPCWHSINHLSVWIVGIGAGIHGLAVHIHEYAQPYLACILLSLCSHRPIPVATRSEAWICGCLLAGNVGSNPARGMDVCRLWMLCVTSLRSVRQADHSSREILLSVVCPQSTVRAGHDLELGQRAREKT